MRSHSNPSDRAGGERPEAAVKRLSLIIAFAAIAVLGIGPATSAHAATLTKPEKQLLALINHTRAKHGMHKLIAIDCLERSSRSHSRDMVKYDYFSHNSSQRRVVRSSHYPLRLRPSGCTSWSIGEDIACGYGPGATPKAIFNAWMHSPAHRAVILDQAIPPRRPGPRQGYDQGRLGRRVLHPRLRRAHALGGAGRSRS